MRGFTLFEILIVIGVMAILASLTLPFGFNFYKSQQLETQSQLVLQVLRLGQSKSIFQENDSSFGIYFANNSYALFQGSSWIGRNSLYDQSFNLPSIISLSGLQEVVFSKMEGLPNATGNIVLNNGLDSRTININALGRINLEE